MKPARKKHAGAGARVAAAESKRQTPRWRLPSGQTLAEFALRSGLLARRLLESVRKMEPVGKMEPVSKPAARRDHADVRANA